MENNSNESLASELRCQMREIDERQELLLEQKRRCAIEFEDEEFELDFRRRKIENILNDYSIEDTRLYELITDSQNAVNRVKASALRRVENLERNIQKEYNKNIELQNELTQKIKKLNEER